MSNYNLVYLPIARQDVIGIVRHISRVLNNPIAADNLAEQIADAVDNLPNFPYSNPLYIPIRPLKHEYRRLFVKNYTVFYWIDEEKQEITIARVVYSRRNYSDLLE